MRGRPWPHPSIARRPWRAGERRVILRGFWGRLLIGIEPLVISAFFAVLAAGALLRHQAGSLFIAPIFAGAALLFLAYAVILMWPSTQALLETFGAISVVDGYVQYRVQTGRDGEPTYWVGVLDEQRTLVAEWPLAGRPKAMDRPSPWPAHVEFTRHAGVLRIDGQSTGVLPDDLPPLGIGAAAAYGRGAESAAADERAT